MCCTATAILDRCVGQSVLKLSVLTQSVSLLSLALARSDFQNIACHLIPRPWTISTVASAVMQGAVVVIMAEKKAEAFLREHSGGGEGEAYANNYSAHRVGISPEEAISVYNHWLTYEEDLNHERYRGPAIAAEAVGKHFLSHRDSQLILDVACGTGFVGEQLYKLGFRALHGLDPSVGLLRRAEAKGIYQQLFCCYLNDQRLDIDDDVYDCAVISGGMGEGHIPAAGLEELARIVKPGGLVCIVMREEYLQHVAEYRERLEARMAEMERAGQWRQLSRDVVPRYSFDNTGVVFCFRVCGQQLPRSF